METTSNGVSADYYEIPEGVTELQDVIMHRNMNGQDAESFRALYRKGIASHSDSTRDTKKIVFYQVEELMRLTEVPINERNAIRVGLRHLLDEIKASAPSHTTEEVFVEVFK